MKKILFLGLLPLFIACSSADDSEQVQTATINVSIAEFSFTVDEMTKHVLDDMSVPDFAVPFTTRNTLADACPYLTFAAFNQVTGECAYSALQSSTALGENFGNLQFALPIGTYTLIAIGYPSSSGVYCTLSCATLADFQQGKTPETFCAAQTMNVTSTEAKSVAMTLSRIVARFAFTTSDVVPTEYGNGSVDIVVKGVGMLLNPTTGLAAVADSVKTTTSLTAGQRVSKSQYCFLPADDCKVEVTVRVFKSSGALAFTKVLTAVPLQRNHKTVASGALFSKLSNVAISANTEWGEEQSYNY